jgi:hypothetical protein
MSKVTRVPQSTPEPRTFEFASATDGHRIIYHEPICADCGSFDVDQAEVPTGDGITEIALVCGVCGAAWPVACVVDWTTPTPTGGQ